MNLTNFKLSKSKTQYDVYKYKLDSNISYNKRKVYRYKVSNVVYDLRTELTYKYLLDVEVSIKEWECFKLNNSWEYIITSLDLLSVIVDHIKGLLKINSFGYISIPEELEDLIDVESSKSGKSNRILNIRWFNSPRFETPKPNELNLSVFHN